jgi:hypothetical protein
MRCNKFEPGISRQDTHFRTAIRILRNIVMVMLIILPFLALSPTNGYADSKVSVVDQIMAIVGNKFELQYKNAGFEKVPEFISIRVYKYEGILEVWGGMNNKDPLKLIQRYKICAMDFTPGTKLMEGDERTPEGSFELSFLSNSKNWFMHINLDKDHLDDAGNVSKDPSFYLCTNYPTKFDKELSKSVGIKKPGSAICLHGNCVSVGCASMQNHDFIEIYYWLTRHQTKKYGKPKAHFLPFKYYQPCSGWINKSIAGTTIQDKTPLCRTSAFQSIDRMAVHESNTVPVLSKLGSEKLVKLWNHIGEREKLFISSPTPQNAELNMSMDILK